MSRTQGHLLPHSVECTSIEEYWSSIIGHLNEALGRELQLSPLLCLLGIYKRPKLRKADNRMIDIAMAVARKEIACHWKSFEGPAISSWQKEVEQWVRAEDEALMRVEASGMRRRPLSESWREVLQAYIEAGRNRRHHHGEPI